MANLNGSSLFTSFYSGLTNTFSYLSQLSPDGVTLESINEARGDSKNNLYLNPTFASYLQTNFTGIDKDEDGVISPDEMTNLTNQMSTKGLSRQDLSQLMMSGMSSDSLNMVLENFDSIDTNHDGYVTQAEISAFQLDASRQEIVDKFNHQMATNMSTFYGDESSSSGTDTYSMLSYKYKNINS